MTVYDALTLARLLDEVCADYRLVVASETLGAGGLEYRRAQLRHWRDELIRQAKEAADAPAS